MSIMVFLESCPDSYDFPAGGQTVIPLASETEFLKTIETSQPIQPVEIAPARKELSLPQAYSLVIFAVRMAIHAVRTGDPRLLRAGLIGLVVDDSLVDWRDILAACSIIEDCASRLGIDFRHDIEKVVDLATERRQETIVSGFLQREPRMRKPDVMGYTPKEGPDGLYYVRID